MPLQVKATQTGSEQDEDGTALVVDNDAAHRVAPNGLPRHTRRLSDKVLIAFPHACDTSDVESATHLLNILEAILTRRPVQADHHRRRDIEGLVAAHERLWHLRHPSAD